MAPSITAVLVANESSDCPKRKEYLPPKKLPNMLSYPAAAGFVLLATREANQDLKKSCKEVAEAYKYTSGVITGSKAGDVTRFGCLERALVSRMHAEPGCQDASMWLHPPTCSAACAAPSRTSSSVSQWPASRCLGDFDGSEASPN